MRRAVIDAQREELLRWRDVGRLPDEGLRVLERELDHEGACSCPPAARSTPAPRPGRLGPRASGRTERAMAARNETGSRSAARA